MNTVPQLTSDRTRLWIEAVLIAVAGAFLYTNSLYVPFQWDDIAFILKEPKLRDLSDIGMIWSISPPRFLVFLSLAINYAISGYDTFSYHLVNIGFHIAASLAAWWLARTVIRLAPLGASDRIFPLFVGLLFVAHPLQTEAVTYIWQRNTSMVAFFYIVSLAAYLRSAMTETSAPQASRRWFWLSFGSVIAATFSKELSVTLPIAIVLADVIFITKGNFSTFRQRLPQLAPFLIPLVIIPLFSIFNVATDHMANSKTLSSGWYLVTQFSVLTTYFRLLILPYDQNLDYDYPIPASVVDVLPHMVLVVGLAITALFLFRRRPVVSFGILFFYLAISVEASILPLADVIFEHRVYLPAVGFFIAVAGLLFPLAEKLTPAKATAALTALLVISTAGYGWATVERNKVWADDLTLWQDVISKSPVKLRPRVNLIVGYSQHKQYDHMEKALREALTIAPHEQTLRILTAEYHYCFKEYGKARAIYESILEEAPLNYWAHRGLAAILHRSKEYRKAAYHYALTLRLQEGNDQELRLGFAEVLVALGLLDQAAAELRRILVDPTPPIKSADKEKVRTLLSHVEQALAISRKTS